MRKLRRHAIHVIAGIVSYTGGSVGYGLAQSYPVKPIRMLAGFAAGSSTDAIARLIAQKLTENLGQSVVVENRTGAAGAIANELAAKSPVDGYTLLVVTPGATILPAIRTKLPYDLERYFAPVSLVANGALALVIHPSVPARSVKELIALARAQPGRLSYGSSGVGSFQHLAGELFNLMGNVNVVHVPYKGGSETVIAAVGGQIEMTYPSVTTALPMLETDKLRALAVTGLKRESLLPSVPTLNESGLTGYDRTVWYGVAVPAGVPKEIITRLNTIIGKAFNTPEMKEALIKLGAEPQTNTPEQFASFIHNEIAQNARLIKFAKVQAE